MSLYISLMFNPYVTQIARQTGMSEWEVRRTARTAVITDSEAQRRGYATAVEYEEALHEFLNGN